MWEILPLKLPASEWWNTDPGLCYMEFVNPVSEMKVTLKWVYTVIYPLNNIIISQDLPIDYNNVFLPIKNPHILNTYIYEIHIYLNLKTMELSHFFKKCLEIED